jgi:hypothetical protein
MRYTLPLILLLLSGCVFIAGCDDRKALRDDAYAEASRALYLRAQASSVDNCLRRGRAVVFSAWGDGRVVDCK